MKQLAFILLFSNYLAAMQQDGDAGTLANNFQVAAPAETLSCDQIKSLVSNINMDALVPEDVVCCASFSKDNTFKENEVVIINLNNAWIYGMYNRALTPGVNAEIKSTRFWVKYRNMLPKAKSEIKWLMSNMAPESVGKLPFCIILPKTLESKNIRLLLADAQLDCVAREEVVKSAVFGKNNNFDVEEIVIINKEGEGWVYSQVNSLDENNIYLIICQEKNYNYDIKAIKRELVGKLPFKLKSFNAHY